uniref:ZF(C2H2)-75 zinc finger protein n=1 Tax=Phallusia mammillata TaxID=59560 RepID=A0A6F9DCW9_9ASCI|nr:ZF(C2H2)-75 zinc finger protein [Phallusia mammillata]
MMTPGKSQSVGYYYKEENTLNQSDPDYQQHVEETDGCQQRAMKYPCKDCDATFQYVTSLHQHEISEHSSKLQQRNNEAQKKNAGLNDKRQFVCETCGRKFALSENLNRHKMIHNDSRPYHCTHCNKSFRLSQHLKEHIRIHTGEKPYKCNICGHAFCQISNLKSHKKTHSKVKAFKCDECGKEFRRSFTLKQHKVAHERFNDVLPLAALQAPRNNAMKTFASSLSPPSDHASTGHKVTSQCNVTPDWRKHSDCRLTTNDHKFSPVWEEFVRTCCPPVSKADDPDQQSWPEINEIARLAKRNNPAYDVTGDKTRDVTKLSAKSKSETSFFVEQIIGRRDSTGSDKEATTSSDDAAGSDVSMSEQSPDYKWKRQLYKEWGSPSNKRSRSPTSSPAHDVSTASPTGWSHDQWSHVVPLIEWKPVITGWRNVVDGRVYSAYRGFTV